jgi:hypothetical protein
MADHNEKFNPYEAQEFDMTELELLKQKSHIVALSVGIAAMTRVQYVQCQWDQMEHEVISSLFHAYPDVAPHARLTRSRVTPGEFVQGTIAVVHEDAVQIVFRARNECAIKDGRMAMKWQRDHPDWITVTVNNEVVFTTDNPYLAIHQADEQTRQLSHACCSEMSGNSR